MNKIYLLQQRDVFIDYEIKLMLYTVVSILVRYIHISHEVI